MFVGQKSSDIVHLILVSYIPFLKTRFDVHKQTFYKMGKFE